MYTFVLEFRGGTYVQQIYGDTLTVALAAYANELRTGVAGPPFPLQTARSVAREISDCAPVPLKGLKSVWCNSGSVGSDYVLLTIIDTKS
jgi:hypothetical protein